MESGANLNDVKEGDGQLRMWSFEELRPLDHMSILSSDAGSVHRLLDKLQTRSPTQPPVMVVREDSNTSGWKPQTAHVCVEEKDEVEWLEDYMKGKQTEAQKMMQDRRACIEKKSTLQTRLSSDYQTHALAKLCSIAVEEGWSDAELKSQIMVEKEAEKAAQQIRTEKMKIWFNSLCEQARAHRITTVIVFQQHPFPKKREANDWWLQLFQNARHFLTQLVSVQDTPTISRSMQPSVDVIFWDPYFNIRWAKDDLGTLLTEDQWQKCVQHAKKHNAWIVRLLRPPSNSDHCLAIFPK